MFGNPQSPLKIRIEQNTNNDDNNSSKIQTTTIHFRSPGEGAIDGFIDSAYQWYLGELRKLEDHSRYLYEMKVPEISITAVGDDNNNGGGSSCTTYKRFKLSNEKTFESLFFCEKESLLGLVDHFGGKSGKYAIKGYPHKLGIMLHGPPGTCLASVFKVHMLGFVFS
jgi:chaperone BCS1